MAKGKDRVASLMQGKSPSYMDYVAIQLGDNKELTDNYIALKQRTRSQITEWGMWFMPEWFSTEFSDYDDQYNLALEETLTHKHVKPDRRYRRVYTSPRAFTKTTKCQLGILWASTEGVNSGQIEVPPKGGDELIFYLTQKDELADEKMGAIWQELNSNIALKERYGDLMGGRKAKAGLEMVLENGVFLNAGGIIGSRRGKHPYNLIADDLESTEDARSPTNREKAWHRWVHEFIPMMMPGRAMFITGNYIDPLCLLYMIANQSNSITTVRKAREKGISIMPAFFSDEFLRATEDEMGSDAFYTEYMNEPRSTTTSPIKHHMLNWYNPANMPDSWWRQPGFVIITYIDVAFKAKETADFTAINTVAAAHRSLKSLAAGENPNRAAIQTTPSFFTLEAKRGHWTPDNVLNEAYLTYQKFGSHKVLMEEAGGSIIFENLYRSRIQTHHQTMPFEMQEHNRFGVDKAQRISTSSVHYSENRVFFNETCPVQQRTVNETINFDPRSSVLHDDLADAQAGAVNNAAECAPRHIGPRYEEEPVYDRVTGDIVSFRRTR